MSTWRRGGPQFEFRRGAEGTLTRVSRCIEPGDRGPIRGIGGHDGCP